MKIEKQLTVNGSQSEVWNILWDVERIAGCIRGCSDVTVVEPEKRYTARITQRIGPFQVSFPLLIDVLESTPEESITVVASGKDARIGSRLKATMRLALRQVEEARTTIEIDTEVALQGRIATLGQSIVSRKADEEIGHFSTALQRELSSGTGSGHE